MNLCYICSHVLCVDADVQIWGFWNSEGLFLPFVLNIYGYWYLRESLLFFGQRLYRTMQWICFIFLQWWSSTRAGGKRHRPKLEKTPWRSQLTSQAAGLGDSTFWHRSLVSIMVRSEDRSVKSEDPVENFYGVFGMVELKSEEFWFNTMPCLSSILITFMRGY